MYRAGIVGLLGLTRAGPVLQLDPCFPKAWPQLSATVRLDHDGGQAQITITILNPNLSGNGIASAQANGIPLAVGPQGVSIAIESGLQAVSVTLN